MKLIVIFLLQLFIQAELNNLMSDLGLFKIVAEVLGPQLKENNLGLHFHCLEIQLLCNIFR